MRKRIIIISILIVLLAITIGFFLAFPEKISPILSKIRNFYNDNTWITFESKRANFSFKHPISWPVSSPTESDFTHIDQTNLGYVDSIIFSEKFYWNAGEGLGFIDVTKENGIKNLDDYIASVNKDSYYFRFNDPKEKVLIPKPKLAYLQIGGEKAVSIQEVPSTFGGNLSPLSFKYVIVKNHLIYTIALYYTQDSKYIDTFQKIVNTFKFVN